jgi:hypothetical protein
MVVARVADAGVHGNRGWRCMPCHDVGVMGRPRRDPAHVDRALATWEDEPRWRQAVLAVSDPIFASVLLLTSCLLLVVAADAGVIPV